MNSTSDDSAVFEADVLAVAAENNDVDDEALAAVVERHQSSVEALPGVENLAYEWRKQYESPLIERTTEAYYLAVPAWVWDEFGDALDVDDALLDALVEVHRRTVVDRTDAKPEPPDKQAYVALDRTIEDSSNGEN